MLKRHQRWPAILALFATALLATPAIHAQQSADWTLARADGSEFSLKDNRGEKTTLVLFWATWCPYCKALMPHLESLVLEHSPDDFEIVAITIGEDGDPASFLKKKGYDFTLLPDGEKVAAIYGVRGTPGVLIFNERSELVFDLRKQPSQTLDTEGMKRRDVAARRAPFWAAQIRGALDATLIERPAPDASSD
ncbi:MAG: TlpA family protein disulfide reductase [Gammaproteobacteria bacterium]